MGENLSMALAELLRKADAEPEVDTLREDARIRGISWMPRTNERPKIAALWPCVSACTV